MILKISMFHTRPDTERLQFVERIQTDTLDTLRNPQIHAALGDYALQIEGLATDIYVPNIRGQRVSVPARYRLSNAVPVIGHRRGENLYLDGTFRRMNPRQRLNAGELFIPTLPPLTPGEHWLQQNDEQAAYIARRRKLLTTFTEEVIGRTLVGIYMDDRPTGIYNVLLAHELIHVKQDNACPWQPTASDERRRFRMRKELEAYHVTYRYARALQDVDYDGIPESMFSDPVLNMTSLVEFARLVSTSAEDPFSPDIVDEKLSKIDINIV